MSRVSYAQEMRAKSSAEAKGLFTVDWSKHKGARMTVQGVLTESQMDRFVEITNKFLEECGRENEETEVPA